MCYSGHISSNTLLLEEKNLKTHGGYSGISAGFTLPGERSG